jgi:hypothetical protein
VPSENLTESSHSITAIQTDEAGNTSNHSDPIVLTIQTTVSIQVFIWADNNDNKRYDEGEDPLEGIVVELLDQNGKSLSAVHASTLAASPSYRGITDEDGKYTFRYLPRGTYLIRFSLTQEAIDEGYTFGGNKYSTTSEVDAQSSGMARVSVETSVNCTCENIKSDSGDAISQLGLAVMMFATMFMTLIFVRRETEKEEF